MVRRIGFLVLAAVSVLVLACGGDGNDGSSPTTQQQPEPTTRATRSGPTASVDPRSGPPGGFVTVSGMSWPPGVLIDVTGVLPPGTKAEPYATTTTDQAGAFTVRFRLETTPDGQALEVGRFDLIVRSASAEVDVPFVVETRRPIQNQGPGG